MTPASRSYQALLQEIDGAVRANDMARAADLAEKALAIGPQHPGLLNLVAQRRAIAGDAAGALTLLERARKLAPRDVHVLNGIGICLKDLDRFDEALRSFDAAIAAEPKFAPARYNKGTLLEEMEEVAGARALYEEAIRLQPNYPEALARLALILARGGQSERAKGLAARALQSNPGELTARLALAEADLFDGKLENAKSGAEAVASQTEQLPQSHAIALGILGDVADRAGHPAEAFGYYTAGKMALQIASSRVAGKPGEVTSLDQVRLLSDYFKSANPEDWTSTSEVSSPCREHVFLVGFPRSGTTLLEQALAGHSDIVTLEEKDLLARPAREFLMSKASLDRLSRALKSSLEIHRAAYWKACASYVPDLTGRILVDKLPLNSVVLCLIAKLFPQAKILFALRDPRDVVLSCFRQRFGLNLAMSEFLTLDGTARFYDAVMDLSQIYREKLRQDLVVTRYEDLVTGFDATMTNICQFLSVEFQPAMRDVASRARERTINTPSAAQVARGLYSGAGQWRRYEEQLKPIMQLVSPWVDRFGYSAT